MKTLYQGAFWSFASSLIDNAVRFLIAIIVVRELGTETYGAISQFSIVTYGLMVLASLNMGNAMNRFLSEEHNMQSKSETFSGVLLVCFGACALIYAVSMPWSSVLNQHWFGGGADTRLYSAVMLGLVIRLLGSEYEAAMRACYLNRYIVLATASSSAITVALLLNLGNKKASIFSIIAILIASDTIKLLILGCLGHGKGLRIARPRIEKIGRYLKYGGPLLMSTISFWLFQYVDRFLLVQWHGLPEAGAFASVSTIAGLQALIWSAIALGALPHLAPIFDCGNHLRTREDLGIALRIGLALSLPGISIATASGDSILSIVGGTEIAGRGTVLSVLCINAVVFGIVTTLALWIQLQKRTLYIGMFWALVGAFKCCLGIMLIPKMGATGAAISTLTSSMLGIGVLAYSTRDAKLLWQNHRETFAIVMLCLLLWLLFKSIGPVSASQTVFNIGVAGSIYIGIVYAIHAKHLKNRLASP